MKEYFNTFKQDNRFFRTIGIDALMYAVLFGIMTLWSMAITKFSAALEGIDIASLESLGSEEIAAETLALIQDFIIKTLAVSLIAFVIVYLIYVLGKSLIWKILKRKKFSFSYYKKSLLMNLIWGALFTIVFLIAVIPSFSQIGDIWLSIARIFSMLSMTILIYFRTISSISLAKDEDVRKSFKEIKNAFDIKYQKPLRFISITFFILYALSFALVLLPQTIYIVSSAVIIILFSGWARMCMIQKEKDETKKRRK